MENQETNYSGIYVFIDSGLVSSIGQDKNWEGLKIPKEDFDMSKIGSYIEKINGEIIYSEGEKLENAIKEKNRKNVEKLIENISNEFDEEISNYLSKYPKREQDTFAEKKREAEKVINGETSIYIDEKAKAIGMTSIQFAQVIIAKNNEWTQKYVELENEKDLKIAKLLESIK